MPRKNKKKQRKEERRRAVQRVRQEKGWRPPQEIEFPDDELMRDMLAFVPDLGASRTAGDAAAETLLMAVLDSTDLIDEPEFGGIYFHPMQAIDIYAELEDERGVDEEMLEALSEEEEEDLFFDLMEDLVRRALTEEMKVDILDALEAAWQRVRQGGDQDRAGILAGMLTLLQSAEGEEMWPEVGLVQAILHRSLEAGFEIVSIVESAGAASMGPRGLGLLGTDHNVRQQFMAVLDKYPGLDAVMTERDVDAWEAGLRALMEGELYVGLFSDEELERAADLATPEGLGTAQASDEEMGRAGIQALRSHLAGLLTLERRAEMREQLLTVLENEVLAGEWQVFLAAMLDDLDDEDPEAAFPVLIAAMLGEMLDMAEEEDDGEAAG